MATKPLKRLENKQMLLVSNFSQPLRILMYLHRRQVAQLIPRSPRTLPSRPIQQRTQFSTPGASLNSRTTLTATDSTFPRVPPRTNWSLTLAINETGFNMARQLLKEHFTPNFQMQHNGFWVSLALVQQRQIRKPGIKDRRLLMPLKRVLLMHPTELERPLRRPVIRSRRNCRWS